MSKGVAEVLERQLPQPMLLKSFYLRWKYIPISYSEQSDHYARFLENTREVLSKTDDQADKVIYYKACNHLLEAELHAGKGENLQALRASQRAYPLITAILDSPLNDPEYNFIRGLYQYYIEHYRSVSFFYRAALFALRNGDKLKGLDALKTCASSQSTVQTEAKSYLAHIFLHFEEKPLDALPYAADLHERYPNNLKFTEVYVETLLACQRYVEAEPLAWQLSKNESEYFSTPGNYFLGVIYEASSNFSQARVHFRQSAASTSEPVFRYREKAREKLKSLAERQE